MAVLIDDCFSQLHVNEAWVNAYSKLPPSHAPVPELHPHQLGSWKRAMIQLRMRGLPDRIIEQMESFFSPGDVRAFLFELKRVVRVRTVKRRS